MKRKLKRIYKILFIIILTIMIYFYIKPSNNKVINSNTDINYNIVEETDTLDILKNMSKKDKRILKIIDNKDKYPQELLDMLSRNIDMTDYMLDYLDKKGKVYSDNIGNVKKGEYPLLLQYDKRWGYFYYGDSVLAINGCGPTVLSMVVAGLTGRNDVTPVTIADYSYKHRYYNKDSGTSWNLMTDGLKKYNIEGINISLLKSNIVRELNDNHPIVLSVRKGDFTTTGHFILIVGMKDDMFIIHDSNSKERSNKLWDYESLKPQIKNLWAYKHI